MCAISFSAERAILRLLFTRNKLHAPLKKRVQLTCRPPLSPVFAHKLAFSQDVAFHSIEKLVLGDAGRQVQPCVQRIQFEKIPVRFSRRWRRTTVADLAK